VISHRLQARRVAYNGLFRRAWTTATHHEYHSHAFDADNGLLHCKELQRGLRKLICCRQLERIVSRQTPGFSFPALSLHGLAVAASIEAARVNRTTAV